MSISPGKPGNGYSVGKCETYSREDWSSYCGRHGIVWINLSPEVKGLPRLAIHALLDISGEAVAMPMDIAKSVLLLTI